MNGFVLALIGVTALGVLFDLIVPDGETSKFVKSIFSIFTVIAIISPIAGDYGEFKLLSSNIGMYYPNDDYVDYVIERRISDYETELSKRISKECEIDCSVDVDYLHSRQEIGSITLIFYQSGILSDELRIYILEKAKRIFSEENFDEDEVVFVWR